LPDPSDTVVLPVLVDLADAHNPHPDGLDAVIGLPDETSVVSYFYV